MSQSAAAAADLDVHKVCDSHTLKLVWPCVAAADSLFPPRAKRGGHDGWLLTHSVGQNLQPHHPLVGVQLQAVDAVEAVVFDQVEGGVNGHLVQDRPLPLRRLT